jgi:maleate isomerase
VTDALGARMKFGVVVPSTNTSVQPEYDEMRPRGVTNHTSRAVIPDDPVHDDAGFLRLLENIRGATEQAIDAVMTCSPGHVIIGMSAETFWDGPAGSDELRRKLEERAGVGVTLGSHACVNAIRRYGDVRNIAVITPYMPVGDAQVRRFFTESGFNVVALEGLRCRSPTLIAHVQPGQLIDAIRKVDGPEVELIIQVGTNLAFARTAALAEQRLGKPVLAVNTCTYWQALRSNGIEDRMAGFSSLLADF